MAVPSSFKSTIGWLIVAEDRGQASSDEIRLPVAIIHSRSETKKSPVVYLSGGPGTSAMRTAAFPGAYPWLEDRDFIVIGQRGTHFAAPALMCPEYREAVAVKSDQVAAASACKERLESLGIGLSNYNSLASAKDLDDLRQVLGIESWNLYGASYGTRLALIYAKRFGERVDSMVLDSPLPPNAIYDDESAENLEQALRSVAKDCAQQSACARTFPELEQRFFQTLQDVSENPVLIEGGNRPVTARDLVSLIPLVSESGVRRAPLTMDRAARLDPVLLGGVISPVQASDFAWGMRFSVWCSEALPFSLRNRTDGPGETLGGYESAAINPDLCDAWGAPALDPSVIEPVTSNIPTLIIAGEFDPLTPPRWGSLTAKTLTRSRLVILRGGSHTSTQQWGGDGCAMSLAAAFLNAPDAYVEDEADDDCLSSRSAPNYQLRIE
ncbi:MAG: alpha/beta hydrolase [Hyphomonadaceae bacterium]|nr:alpha/beta hydrolase [Hyphomonadaceae bacterium]